MKELHKILLLVLMLLVSSSAVAQTYPKREVRAVWLTTFGGLDWPGRIYSQSQRSMQRQKSELCKILDQLQKANINTVLFQARIRSTVTYQSSMEPWDGSLSGFPGTSPGYDALEFAIQECHRRGMECHAWVVTMTCGKWNGYGPQQLRKKLPKEMFLKIGEDCYFKASDPRTGDYLAKICRDITRRYDVDGIHLDYIRFPETMKVKPEANLGRSQITSIVRKIHDAVKAEKPWVKLSCSPIGKHDDLKRYWSHGWNARQAVLQDAQAWMREGLMDMEFPMMYFRGNNFYPFAIDWQEHSYGASMCPGLGIYFMSPSEKNWPLIDITREMNVLRQNNMGYAFFRCKFFLDNTKGLYDYVCNTFNRYPALTRPVKGSGVRGQGSRSPKAPKDIVATTDNGRTTILWYGAQDYSDGPYLTYNIYASQDYPVDITKAENIIAQRFSGEKMEISHKHGEGLNFAVTAVDRYGNESEACQMNSHEAIPNMSGKPGWYYVTHPLGDTKPTPKKTKKSKKKRKR